MKDGDDDGEREREREREQILILTKTCRVQWGKRHTLRKHVLFTEPKMYNCITNIYVCIEH